MLDCPPMKKTTLAAAGIGTAVVLVAAYAGAIAWSGRKIEARHHDYIERLQAQAPFLRLTEQSYERGFASSTSRTTFEVGCAGGVDGAGGEAPPRIVLTETIQHGPFAGGTVAAAVIDAQLGLVGPGTEKYMAMFSAAPLSAHTVVDFSGQATSTVTGAAAKIPLPGGAEVAWQGLSGTVVMGGDMRGFSYRIKSPGLTIANGERGVGVRVAGLELQADGRYLDGSSRLGIGKGQGGIEAIEVTTQVPSAAGAEPAPFTMVLSGLKYTSETKLSGELLGQTATLAGAAALNGAKVDRFDMQASMKNLHAPTYVKLMDRFSSLPGCKPAAAPVAPARMLGEMQADLMAMARYNPEMALDKLTIDYAGKHAEISYSLALQGVTAADAALTPIALLMTRGHAKAAMRMPVAWIRQLSQEGASRMQGAVPGPEVVDAMIDKGVAEGYIVREGDDVKSSLDFAAGVATVNGKPLPAPGSAGARPRRP